MRMREGVKGGEGGANQTERSGCVMTGGGGMTTAAIAVGDDSGTPPGGEYPPAALCELPTPPLLGGDDSTTETRTVQHITGLEHNQSHQPDKEQRHTATPQPALVTKNVFPSPLLYTLPLASSPTEPSPPLLPPLSPATPNGTRLL